MLCPFTGPKIFCAGPNFLSQPKNLTTFSASSKTFVLAQKPILLNANHLFCLAHNFCDCHKISVNKSLLELVRSGTKKLDLHKTLWDL